MKIVFKNGSKLEVLDEVIEIVHQQLTKGNNSDFQAFINAADGRVDLIINVKEILYIEREWRK